MFFKKLRNRDNGNEKFTQRTNRITILCLSSECRDSSGRNRTLMSWASSFRVVPPTPKRNYFLNMKVA